MEINIREAEESDFPKIAEIFIVEIRKPPYSEQWTREKALKKIEDYLKKDRQIFIAETNNGTELGVVGFIILSEYYWESGEVGFVDEVYIKPGFQGKGIGSKLMNKIENLCRERGMKHISLVSHRDSKAFNFYKNKNYKDIGYVELIKELEDLE